MHFAEELTGRYRENRPGYPAIAISDVSHLSCVSNDFGYEYVFSRFIEAVGMKGDVLLEFLPQVIQETLLKRLPLRVKRYESHHANR